MEMTFNKAIDVLVKAYLNDSLKHQSPCNCAIGNLLKSCGVEFPSTWYSYLFVKRGGTVLDSYGYVSAGEKELKNISYTIDQISEIEDAFEKNSPNDEDGYKGLLAVVDVLAGIHKVDLSVREEVKSLFVKECV